jgi:hypothetical protein
MANVLAAAPSGAFGVEQSYHLVAMRDALSSLRSMQLQI